MCSGDRDRVAEAHQLGQHFGSTHDRHPLLACRRNLRVGFIDRAGNDYGVCVAYVVGSVADEDGGALAGKALCLLVGLEVGPLHVVTEAQHDLGYSRHAGTADPDKMNAMDASHLPDHATAPACWRQTSVMRRSASGHASARALAARSPSAARDCSHSRSSSAR